MFTMIIFSFSFIFQLSAIHNRISVQLLSGYFSIFIHLISCKKFLKDLRKHVLFKKMIVIFKILKLTLISLKKLLSSENETGIFIK